MGIFYGLREIVVRMLHFLPRKILVVLATLSQL